MRLTEHHMVKASRFSRCGHGWPINYMHLLIILLSQSVSTMLSGHISRYRMVIMIDPFVQPEAPALNFESTLQAPNSASDLPNLTIPLQCLAVSTRVLVSQLALTHSYDAMWSNKEYPNELLKLKPATQSTLRCFSTL